MDVTVPAALLRPALWILTDRRRWFRHCHCVDSFPRASAPRKARPGPVSQDTDPTAATSLHRVSTPRVARCPEPDAPDPALPWGRGLHFFSATCGIKVLDSRAEVWTQEVSRGAQRWWSDCSGMPQLASAEGDRGEPGYRRPVVSAGSPMGRPLSWKLLRSPCRLLICP